MQIDYANRLAHVRNANITCFYINNNSKIIKINCWKKVANFEEKNFDFIILFDKRENFII